MNFPKKQGKQSLPKEVQDNITHNIQQIFPDIHREIIQNILTKEEWDLEKSLRFLHATRKSFLNIKNNQKSKNNVPISNKPTISKGNKPTNHPKNKPDLFKKGPEINSNKSKPDGIEKGDWVVVNKFPLEQNGPKPKKKKKKKNPVQTLPTKEDLIKTVQDESNPSTFKANKNARRAQILQSYGIIKHIGDDTNRISAYIKEGIKVMVLLRGCSGSGKSTYANQILLKSGAQNPENHIFSTDNFFVRAGGKYNFNGDLLQEAHEWNQKLVMHVACEGRSPIFVDNTNSRIWEMKEYAVIAVQFGYILETLEPPTPWFFNEDILVRKTSHSVPRETVRKMLDRYEANLTGQDVIRGLQLSYVPPMIPPQGAMAGIDSPISKKHSKMLNIPLNDFSTQNSNSLKPNPLKVLKSELLKDSGFTLGINSIGAFENITLASASKVPKPPILKSENSSAFVKGCQQETEHSSKESSSDITESDPEEMISSSSSSSDDEDYQEELDDQICTNDELEYVMIAEDNRVVFQKEHTEMEGVKTLVDFRKVGPPQKFSEDFESYLLNYMETSGFKQENNVNVGACGDSIVCTNTEPSVAPSSSSDLLLTNIDNSKTKTSLYPTLFQTEYLNPVLKNLDSSTNTYPKDFEILQKAVIGDNYPGFQVIEGKPVFYSGSKYNSFVQRKFSSVEKGTMTSLEQQYEEAVGGNTTIDKLHLMFPKVTKEKLLELFGESLDDIDWAVGLLLDSGQEMVQSPETTGNCNQEDKEMVPEKQEIKKKVSFSIIPDLSSKIAEEPPRYIGEWDFRRELPKELPKEMPMLQRTSKPQYLHIRGIDIATNTHYVDFETLRNINSGTSYNAMNVRVVPGNRFFISGLTKQHIPTSSVLMLEKGTMTSDIQTNCLQMESGIEKLSSMFPRVSRDNLEELFEKCQKNIDWAAGLLLDSGQEMSELYTSLEPTEVLENVTATSPDIEKEGVSVEDTVCSTDKKSKKKKKIRVSKSDNELYKEMQEEIQNNFFLDDSHYSSERMKSYFQRKNKNKISENDIDQFPPAEDNTDDLNDDVSDTEDDHIFMMDSDLILQLQARFGGLLRPNMIGEKTVVKLPLNLARQLHSYVMESVHEHIEDVFTDEDEEFARHLQEEEMRSQGTPSLNQIMDEEVALRKSQKDLGYGRSMACTLSKQLLIERFPTMDPSTLAMILDDTNHSLHQATSLLSSAGYKSVESETPTTEDALQSSKSDEKCSLSREEAIKQADAYGDVASQLYELRKDCLRKSQKAYREGNHSVALYYSDMARWYMERIEKSNSMAAKAILSGYEGWTTLDLHFLHISEALNVLNLFIDEVIRNLKDTNKRRVEVYVITGRGLHSSGGRSKLKPAVQSLLKKRDLKFLEQNPGMLRVFIPKNAVISYMTAVTSAV